MTDRYPMPAHLARSAAYLCGHGSLTLAVIAFIGLLVGVVIGIALSRVLRSNSLARNHPHRSEAPPSSPISHPARTDALAAQRRVLIAGMLTVRGLVEDPQIADVIDESLRSAGVTVFDATGQTKDPRYHRVRHSEPAPDPGGAGTVARTLAPGYIDAGHVLQPADVVVYL